MKYLNNYLEGKLFFKDYATDPQLIVTHQTTKGEVIYKLVNQSDKFGEFSVKFLENAGDYTYKYCDNDRVLEEGLLRVIGNNKTLISDNLTINYNI